MCGIAGKIIFDKAQTVELAELKRMTDAIYHRGPDDEGFFIRQNVGLGFRRLSIIDLQTGHQPLANSDESIWITFNGEIYNFKELRSDLTVKGYHFKTQSDTEVIVNLYEEYGESCVGLLRGMFAFVIWDDRKKRLFGARDRFGIKPMYIYQDQEKFIWGSEIKAITASQNIKKSLDYRALESYLAFGHIIGDQSIFNEIRKLRSGHYFILDLAHGTPKFTTEQYWTIKYTPDFSKNENDWIAEIQYELAESVRMHLVSDVPLGAFLSGGIDSSSVVALMSQANAGQVKTFSIGFKEEKFNELRYARLVADKYHTEHHEQIVEPESIDILSRIVRYYDEPFADSSAIPTYYVSKFAKEYVTVVLSGDGGDELFAGYRSYLKMLQLNQSPFNPGIPGKYFWKIVNRSMPDYFYGKGYAYYLSKKQRNIGAYFCLWKDYERKKLIRPEFRKELLSQRPEQEKVSIIRNCDGDFLTSMQQLDMKTYLPDDILTKVDRASMMNSLETRVPLLDHKFAELTFRIPSKFKLNGNLQKYIFKKAMAPYLPSEVLEHKKQGFGVPLSYWFKDDLREYIHDTLINGRNHLTDHFDFSQIEQIIGYHHKGGRDYSAKIWSLLFLNEWFNQNQL